MRGEDLAVEDGDFDGAGSPPHARGRRVPVGGGRGGVGITPACAGKTLHIATGDVIGLDHPRMRGEDV